MVAMPNQLDLWLESFKEPADMDEVEDPFQPEHPNDLVGVDIVYLHPQNEDRCTGEVIDWQVHPQRGLYLLVDQHGRNLPKWVHESGFICYGWELESLNEWEAETAQFAVPA